MSQMKLFSSKRFVPFFFTQFFGAFNDNIFKNTLMLIIAFGAIDQMGVEINLIMNVAAGLFILPYLLFSGIAGQITDLNEKSSLMRKIKLFEIGIMALAAVGFITGSYFFLLFILFLMGVQSTFFGPAKYAILPQHLKENEIVGGNALVEMGTFVAILLGTIGAGIIMEFDSYITIVTIAVLTFAAIGYFFSRGIPEAPAPSENTDHKINWNIFSSTWDVVKTVKAQPNIYLAIMAISWFWFLGAAYLTQFPNFAKTDLNGDSSLVTLLLAIFTLGIGLGSMVCEKLSKSRVELGIVPLGALGLSIFGIDLYSSVPPVPESVISWSSVLSSSNHIWLVIDLFGIGFFGGIFIVPLYAYVQTRSEESYRARTIAVINIMNALFMVTSAIAGILFLSVMGLTIPEFFLVIAIMNIVVCGYVFAQVDEFAVRFFVWMLSHTMYRVKYENVEFPEEGAGIIVCNHVSFMDAPILAGACPRNIRFVMDHQIFKNPFLGWFFRLVRAIPIAPEGVDKEIYDAAFREVSAALKNGELVCIFPEGKLTRSGSLNEFKGGVDKILEQDPVTVYPYGLIGLWGSVFSNEGGKALAKAPKRFWSRVTLKGGEPVSPEAASSKDLESIVSELIVDKK